MWKRSHKLEIIKLKWEGRKSEESNASALMLPFFDDSKSDLLHLYEWSGYF